MSASHLLDNTDRHNETPVLAGRRTTLVGSTTLEVIGRGGFGDPRPPSPLESPRARSPGEIPLLPDSLRPWVLGVSVLGVACLTGLGFDVRDSSGPVLFDRPVDLFFLRLFDHRVAILFRDLGRPNIFETITLVAVVVLVVFGDYRAAVATAGSVALAVVLVEDVLKPFFDRRHPYVLGPTFPSGHTAVAIALAGVVMLALRAERPWAGCSDLISATC